MKKILSYLIIALIAVSCLGRKNRDSVFFWNPTKAAFDTLTRDLDRAWCLDVGKDSLLRLTDRLEAEARRHPSDREMKARCHYFRGRWFSAYAGYPQAIKELDAAESIFGDSAAYPYEFNRIRYVRSIDPSRTMVQMYFDNVSTSSFFESRGDSVMLAVSLANIGNALRGLGDTLASGPYFSRAIDLLNRCGMKRWSVKFRLSQAQACRPLNPKLSDSILSALREMPEVQEDTLYYNILLHVSYLSSGDIGYIRKAYRLVRLLDIPSVEALYESYLSSDCLMRGETDSAVSLSSSAMSKTSSGTGLATRMNVTLSAAEALERTGDKDNAAVLMKRYIAMSDTLIRRNIATDVRRNEMRLTIAAIESQEREKSMRERSRFWIASIGLVAVAVTVVLLLYRRTKRLEMQRVRAELELTRSRLQLASSAVALEEKDKVIDSTIETIDSLGREKKITPSDANIVAGVLRVHKSSREEFETFRQVHEKLSPNFAKRLKEDYPGLSENNIKMAAYVAMGMDNKQIARTMMIEYKSVITARHRIRAKMGLGKNDSLENALRRYSEY